MKLSEIHFPVYRLSKDRPIKDGSITFYRKAKYNIDTNKMFEYIKIIDDTEIEGDTLGRRRLQIPSNVKYIIKRSYKYIKDVIKQSDGGYWFIDNLGRVFQYKKSMKVPLVCREILEVHPGAHGMGSTIEVKGIVPRFKTMYIPTNKEKYVALLKMHSGYVLYGLYEEKFEDTWRKV